MNPGHQLARCRYGENMKQKILDTISEFYIESRDFNGIPYTNLADVEKMSHDDLKVTLKSLLNEGMIEIMYGDVHPNPHIKAFSNMDVEKQKQKLENATLLKHACIYPSAKHLQKLVPPDEYSDRPYTRELAMGAGQLDFRAFDVSVLEYYRNDPRYHYENNDISGWISVRDKYYESSEMPKSDQTLLQTFGFCYTERFDRGVAVFLRYLHDLTPEHQQIWRARELRGDYALHPDYYRNSILGDWGTRISIFDAFLKELKIINNMCSAMSKPPLFRETFENARPREFGFLLRPTLGEFNSFAHLLDKMMSDNINKSFFESDVETEEYEERNDGKTIVKHKGTIKLLDEWLQKFFRPADRKPIEEMLSAIRKVRNIRQKPAHSVKENEFDQKYFKDQRELIIASYKAIRMLRLILANHPRVKANPPKIDKHLFEGKIWDI